MNEDKDQEPPAGWVFKPGSSDAALPQEPAPGANYEPQTDAVQWSASEYVANDKTPGWFLTLGLGAIALAIIIYFMTTDIMSVIVIMSLAIIVGVFAARQPHVLEYALDARGIHMGHKFYPYGVFKSFSIVKDGGLSHIVLSPLKRFMPPLTVHYPPNDEDRIMDVLSDYLPYEEQKRDLVESITRRVRF